MTPTDKSTTTIAARIEEWEKEAKEGMVEVWLRGPEHLLENFNSKSRRILTLCAALKIAIQDLSSIRNIDQGKLKNLAQACLDDIESKFKPNLEGLGE